MAHCRVKQARISVAVVIPTHNRSQALDKCLSSVEPELSGNDFIIVVDAGSNDQTSQILEQHYPNVAYLIATANDWWAALTNLGVEQALRRGATHVLTLNDDTVILPGAINRLKAAAANMPKGIFSSVCCYLDAPGRVFFAGRRRAKWLDRFYYLNLNESVVRLPTGLRQVDLLHGMCTLIPSCSFDETGGFDEAVFPHLFADDDFVLRAVRSGYLPHVVLDSIVLNDRKTTGANPYDRRLSPREALSLLSSRRSAFEVSTRSRFLWRHRRGPLRFLLTWCSDYARLLALVSLRWLLPDHQFKALSSNWARRRD